MQRKGFSGLAQAGLLSVGLGVGAAMGAPAIHVEPGPSVLAGEPLHVRVTGARPGSRVTLTAERWFADVPAEQRSSFSWRGDPLPFVPAVGYEDELRGHARKLPVIVRRVYERGRAMNPERAARARIPVERIAAPMLVIGAYGDPMWPSGQMAQAIAERRLDAGRATEVLLFPDAGHLLHDTGDAPTTGYDAGLRRTGSTPQANAAAQARVWRRTLEFLKRVLAVLPE